MKVRWDQPTWPAAGGRRYLLVSLERSAAGPTDTALVIDWSRSVEPYRDAVLARVSQLVAELHPVALWAFNDRVTPLDRWEQLRELPARSGSCLYEAWLRGCHSLAGDEPAPGHCVVLSDGHANQGECRPPRLAQIAAEVWERTAIATSALPLGAQPRRELLRGLALAGGGGYGRVIVPRPRRVVEIRHPASIQVEAVSPTRYLARAEGTLQAVPRGGWLLFGLRLPAQAGASPLEVRCEGERVRLRFSRGKPEGPPHPLVLGRLARCRPPAARHATAEGAAELVGRFVPPSCRWSEPARDLERVLDRSQGAILWGAVGSALGRPLVGLEPATIRARYGPQGLQHYEPWREGSDNRGEYSGDLQMVREVALTLLEGEGHFDPERFGARLVKLLERHRGIGQACEVAGAALRQGAPWWRSGVNTAGNGAALRAAPLGIVGCLGAQPSNLFRETVVSAVITHTHPVAVASAVAMALAVAWCLRGGGCRPELAGFLADALEGIESEPTAQRRLGSRPITLAERLRRLPDLLAMPIEDGLQVTWNGAFALESVPAALLCFLKHPDDPRQALLAAVNAGNDADSVGCMAGQLVGACYGADRLRQESAWFTGLEDQASLAELGHALGGLAQALQKSQACPPP